MNQNPQNPQQPQPPQPGWGMPPQPPQPWGMPPQPPKKSSAGKIIGFGCLGVVALFVILGVIGAAVGSNGSSNKSDTQAAASPTATHSSPAGKPAAGSGHSAKPSPTHSQKKDTSKTVVFKVWGNAPAGALGPIDITYGSDSDNRQGHWKNGGFTATLPLNKDAMYYTVTAQLQGSGDIHCSVTIDGHTKTGHASGGYNVCDAQLSGGLFGGWD